MMLGCRDVFGDEPLARAGQTIASHFHGLSHEPGATTVLAIANPVLATGSACAIGPSTPSGIPRGTAGALAERQRS